MAQKGYREPNVYTTTTRVTPTVAVTPVDMYPLVIGTGLTAIKRTGVAMTIPWETNTDESGAVTASPGPFTEFEDKVTAIGKIYTTDTWGDLVEIPSDHWTYTKSESGTSYTFAWTADEETGELKIIKNGYVSKPEDIVYLDYTAEAGDDHYTLQRFTLDEDVAEYYGEDIVDGVINKISLGAQVTLRGGSDVVYVLQVPHRENGNLALEYLEALEENVVDLAAEPIWRITAVDNDPEVKKAIRKYANEMSLPEERSEKFANMNFPYAADYTKFDDVVVNGKVEPGLISGYRDFIAKYGSYRAQTFYPCNAEYTFSDGTVQVVDSAIIACAYAGFEQTLERKSQSATNSSIPAGIFNLNIDDNLKLKRAQKNALAQLGVTLLTQQTEYGAINVRDALSMDMSTYQVQDPCVTMAADFVAKNLRRQLGVYIGKYNIDPETISKVRATADTTLAGSVQSKVIKSYEIVSIMQDTENPMCLVMHIRVGVLYPLKQIDINIVLD